MTKLKIRHLWGWGLCGGMIIVLVGLVLASAEARIADTLEAMQEKSLGQTDAPVTVVEFASLTCHHCRHFHENILPKLEDNEIKNGQVRYIYRDFPLDIYALRAGMVARCSGTDKFFTFLKVFYRQQSKWTTAKDPFVALARLARIGGMTGEEFKQCVGNKGLEDALLQDQLEAGKSYKIQSTPTLIINGEKYQGSLDYESVSDAIADALD